jgi:polyhydroxyalkanoate synthesis regulator phasin|tara:strand:- start:77 stop:427 length:351 start_codon:yes stop_codon:yes gene_type:complete
VFKLKEIIKKSFLLGLGAATLTKNQAQKIVKELVSRNAISIKEGRDLMKKVKKEALKETSRVRRLAEKEAKTVAGKLGIESKIQITKVKKRLRSIDKELSSRGKNTLKKIMKELSR